MKSGIYYLGGWSQHHLLLELAFVPAVLLLLALPGQVVVVLATLHERDEEVGAVISQVQGHFGLGQLFFRDLHLCAFVQLHTPCSCNLFRTKLYLF